MTLDSCPCQGHGPGACCRPDVSAGPGGRLDGLTVLPRPRAAGRQARKAVRRLHELRPAQARERVRWRARRPGNRRPPAMTSARRRRPTPPQRPPGFASSSCTSTGWRKPTGNSPSAKGACGPSSTPAPTPSRSSAATASILDLNPAGRALIELEASSRPLGVRLDMLATDPHRLACRSLAARVFRGESATVELEIQGLRGRRRWIEIHATPLPGDDGDVSALVCVSRDITARRGRRRRYAIAKRNGAGVFGSPMIGILFWDSAGAVTDANDAFLQLIGYSREDLGAGRVSWLEMTPLDERHLDERALDGLDRPRLLRARTKSTSSARTVRGCRRDRCGAGRRLAPARGRLRAGHHGAARDRKPAAGERGAVPQHGGACAPDPVGGRGGRALRLRQPELARLQRRAARRGSRGRVLRRAAPRRRRGQQGRVPRGHRLAHRLSPRSPDHGGATASTAT